MKNLVDIINEGVTPGCDKAKIKSLKSHTTVYNNFVKWYDKQLSHMNRDELVALLNVAIEDIKNDELNQL